MNAVKVTLLQIWKSPIYVCFQIKIIPRKFRILNPKSSRVICPWSLWISLKVCWFLTHILLFLNVCKQTFHISYVRISQKVKVFWCDISNILLSYENKDIGRFWNLHSAIAECRGEIRRLSTALICEDAAV